MLCGFANAYFFMRMLGVREHQRPFLSAAQHGAKEAGNDEWEGDAHRVSIARCAVGERA